MKKLYWIILIIVILLAGLGYYFFDSLTKEDNMSQSQSEVAPTNDENGAVKEKLEQVEKESDNGDTKEVVADNLEVPWEMVFLPDGSILLTERNGTLKKIGEDGFETKVSGVLPVGEGGLLGLALHPNYEENNWIYLYHTLRNEEGEIENNVERYQLEGSSLISREIIVDDIPGSINHDGGRIEFGPDEFLYITTGDAGNSANAQDTSSLAGKILRVRDDGSIPEDNPFGNQVYSYGHRNAQGIAWDDEGQLWATEHGRSGLLSGYDEVNRIEKGANYGWPRIQGDQRAPDMEAPVINSGPTTTWAPSGMVYHKGSLFFAGLRGEALYEYVIENSELRTHLEGEFGRLRNVVLGENNELYILTSNTDGRGEAILNDDKIIRISVNFLQKIFKNVKR